MPMIHDPDHEVKDGYMQLCAPFGKRLAQVIVVRGRKVGDRALSG